MKMLFDTGLDQVLARVDEKGKLTIDHLRCINADNQLIICVGEVLNVRIL